jgi:EAL domain-containing protein (putative c-di-GMP-specific phosphodiesterase class I)
VNLSARDVNDPTLPATIAALLERHDVPAESLTIELTESTVLSNEERTISVLERIRDLGCKISIDDFGTGYASLSYLIKLPASELKIDQAFVRDLDSDEQSRTIFRHCVDIAHSLGLTATAEGIETEEIETIVADFGCDTGQGYFMSRPLPFEQFVEFASAARSQKETTG